MPYQRADVVPLVLLKIESLRDNAANIRPLEGNLCKNIAWYPFHFIKKGLPAVWIKFHKR